MSSPAREQSEAQEPRGASTICQAGKLSGGDMVYEPSCYMRTWVVTSARSAELMEVGKGCVQGAEGLGLEAAWDPTLGYELIFPLSLLKFVNREMMEEQGFRTRRGETQERSCPRHGSRLLST